MKKMKADYKFMVPWKLGERGGLLVSDDGKHWDYWCSCRQYGFPLCDAYSPIPMPNFAIYKMVEEIKDYLNKPELDELANRIAVVIESLTQMIPEIHVPVLLADWASKQIIRADAS